MFSIGPINSDWVLQWWSMSKYIWKHKETTSTFISKNIELLILERANLHWNFSSIPKNGSDMYSNMYFVGNLSVSKAYRSKLEKFQCSLALPNIKYNSSILF